MRLPTPRRPGTRRPGANRRAATRPVPQRRRTRPAGARRPGPEPAAKGARRRPGRLTSRAAVLGLAVCAVVLTLAYPMREYLAQRNQISQLVQMQHDQRARVTALENRRRQWDDPAFVKAQARERLQYVMPGEVGYVVIDPSGKQGARAGKNAVTVAPPSSSARSPWYSQLWGTVRAADSAK